MDKIQRQILENQHQILQGIGASIVRLLDGEDRLDAIKKIELNVKRTEQLLNPTKDNEPCCEMDASCEVSEQ